MDGNRKRKVGLDLRKRRWRWMTTSLGLVFVLGLAFTVYFFYCRLSGLGGPPPAEDGMDIVRSARLQIGVTTAYVADYRPIDFPNGDVPRTEGVCSDVVIRALRDARGIDLQRHVCEDMHKFYLAYPVKSWLKGFDRSIVHRRVINLERYFERRGWQVPIDDDHPLLPGDIVTCRIVGKLPHVMIVSDRLSQKGHPLGIHNVAHGTVEEDCLFRYGPITRYRCAATMTIPLPLK